MPAEGCSVSQAVVVIGGGGLSPRALAAVQPDAVVLAADSGFDHAVAAGLHPAQLVGDLDSISEAGRATALRDGVPTHAHPAHKDATDTELAIGAAMAVPSMTHLLVVGGSAADDQRLDHLLGTLLALGAPGLGSLESVRAVLGTAEVTVIHPGRTATLPLADGDTFSLLALHGEASGIDLKGATWELDGATLTPHEARGVSNVARGHVVVRCTSGVLTVVAP
jgi:thiamine pyrophosphokinase